MKPLRICLVALPLFGPILGVGAARAATSETTPSPTALVAEIKVPLEGCADEIEIRRSAEGALVYVLHHHDGRLEELSPEAFTRRVYEEETRRPWWLSLLNITSPFGLVWVTLGLAGQLLFSARMVVQWLASERSRRSVVPESFWWISLLGASMLIVYFIWRKDLVGVIGQSTGWVIYLRNLRLIHRGRIDGGVPE